MYTAHFANSVLISRHSAELTSEVARLNARLDTIEAAQQDDDRDNEDTEEEMQVEEEVFGDHEGDGGAQSRRIRGRRLQIKTVLEDPNKKPGLAYLQVSNSAVVSRRYRHLINL